MENTMLKKSGRVYLLDEIRGFAILCMVVYHAMFQLHDSFGVDVPIFFEPWFDYIRDFFAGMFIFISGVMCRYSHDNTKRGAKCFLLGMIITFVMPFFSEYGITFGILHLLGISMMIYGVLQPALEKIPAVIGLVIFALIAAFTYNAHLGYLGFGALKLEFSEKLKNIGEFFPLGIIGDSYSASDYFPIMPWFFVFLAGSYVGYWFKNGSMPKSFYKPHFNWLAAVGRVTIWIYILHAPLIFGIFSLIFK
ncbi:MAG: DUF1624 domain-containing protein [Oscillospiraceae bacterium]|nr:DUF1624 domain-containing protein [Oscillospiraceae bacterium]